MCLPLLQDRSGLECGKDFDLAYSPERVNPGDTQWPLTHVTKIVAGWDKQAADRAARLYSAIARDGVFRVSSLEVAELAKVFENSQRDVNIALANEVSRFCRSVGLSFAEVLRACSTKWNFQAYTPGLVGGHCIPVDPYYLIHRINRAGTLAPVLAAARATNESTVGHVANEVARLLASRPDGRVMVLGLSYKADVPDVRNSGAIELVQQLCVHGFTPQLHDPICPPHLVRAETGLELEPVPEVPLASVLVYAVAHAEYRGLLPENVKRLLKQGGHLVDLTGTLSPDSLPKDLRLWSL